MFTNKIGFDEVVLTERVGRQHLRRALSNRHSVGVNLQVVINFILLLITNRGFTIESCNAASTDWEHSIPATGSIS